MDELQRPEGAPGVSTGELMRRTAVVTVTVLGIVGLVLLLGEIRSILLWVLIGIVFAIGLQPAVSWLMRRGLGRILAAIIVSFFAIVVVIGVIVAVAWPVVQQADEFIRALPGLVDTLFGPGGRLNFIETRLHVIQQLSRLSPGDVANVLVGNQAGVVSVVTRAASLVAATVTILTIMVMLLIEGPKAWQSILGVLVGEERVWAQRIGDNFLRAVGGYVRGNLTISLVAGVASYILLKILGVPYAETLAVVVALLDIIPLVGATIGAVIVCIVGFATGGTTTGIVLVVYFAIYQQFENNLLQNIVYSRTVSLSPLIVFIAALIGATLGGIVGVLLAIPLASAGWVLAGDLLRLRRARRERRYADPDSAPLLAGAGPHGGADGGAAAGS